MPTDLELSIAVVHTDRGSLDLISAQGVLAGNDTDGQLRLTRWGIGMAYARIAQQWRDTPYRQTLIAELTALDWRVRTLDVELPTDAELIRQISLLRSQIWLSPDITARPTKGHASMRGDRTENRIPRPADSTASGDPEPNYGGDLAAAQ